MPIPKHATPHRPVPPAVSPEPDQPQRLLGSVNEPGFVDELLGAIPPWIVSDTGWLAERVANCIADYRRNVRFGDSVTKEEAEAFARVICEEGRAAGYFGCTWGWDGAKLALFRTWDSTG